MFRRLLVALSVVASSWWTSSASGTPTRAEIPSLEVIGPQTGRFSVQAQFTTSIVSNLTEGKGIALSAHYGLLDRLKVGLRGVYLASSNTGVLDAIYQQGVDPVRPLAGSPLAGLYHLHWLIGAEAQFTPINAQLYLSKESVLNFELFIPLAVSLGHLRRPQISVTRTGELGVQAWDNAFRPVFDLGLGARAYITPWLALSAEFRQYVFPEATTGVGGVNARPFMQFGLQFAWGSETRLPDAPRDAVAAFADQRLEVGAQLSAGFYDRLTDSLGFSGTIGYHLFEHWQLEAFGTKLFPTPSELAQSTFQLFSLRSNLPEQSELLWAAGMTVQFIPLKGRFNVLGRTMAASPYLGVGIGVGAIRLPCDAGMRIDPEVFGDNAMCPLIPVDADANAIVYEPDRLRPVGVLSAGLRLRLAEHFALRLEIKDHIHSVRVFRPDVNQNEQLQSSIRHIWMSQVGLSILFGRA